MSGDKADEARGATVTRIGGEELVDGFDPLRKRAAKLASRLYATHRRPGHAAFRPSGHALPSTVKGRSSGPALPAVPAAGRTEHGPSEGRRAGSGAAHPALQPPSARAGVAALRGTRSGAAPRWAQPPAPPRETPRPPPQGGPSRTPRSSLRARTPRRRHDAPRSAGPSRARKRGGSGREESGATPEVSTAHNRDSTAAGAAAAPSAQPEGAPAGMKFSTTILRPQRPAAPPSAGAVPRRPAQAAEPWPARPAAAVATTDEPSPRARALHDQEGEPTFLERMAREDPGFDPALLRGSSFLYVVQAGNSAYDLRVATRDEVASDRPCATLSLAGVTTYDSDGQPEFTPLQQWERESSLFRAVSTLPFIRRYRTWKAFTVWSGNVRRNSRANVARFLRHNVFVLQPLLRAALQRVHNACLALRRTPLFHIEPQRTYTLSDFRAEQDRQLASLRDALADFSARTRRITLRTAEHWLQACLEAGGFEQRAADVDVSAKFAATPRTPHVPRSTQHTGGRRMPQPSPRAVEAAASQSTPANGSASGRGEVSFTERASLRSQSRVLVRFLRVVDFRIVAALHDLARWSTQEALKVMRRQRDGLPLLSLPLPPPPEASTGAGAEDTTGGRQRAAGAGLAGPVASPHSGPDGFSDLAHQLGLDDCAEDTRRAAADARAALEPVEALRWRELTAHFDGNEEAAMEAATCSPLFAVELTFTVHGPPDRAAREGHDSAAYFADDEVDFTARVDADLVLRPPAGEYTHALDDVIAGALAELTDLPRVLAHRETRGFFRLVQDELPERGGDLRLLFAMDASFREASAGLRQALEDAFRGAHARADGFRPLVDIYVENERALRTFTLPEVEEMPLEDVYDRIDHFQRQRERLDGSEALIIIDSVQVDASALKQRLVPSPLRCLDALFALVPKVAAKQTDALLDELSRARERLAQAPTTVDEFVSLQDYLATLDASAQRREAIFQRVSRLYALLGEHEVAVDDDAESRFVLLQQSYAALGSDVEVCEANRADQHKRFSKELSDRLPRLHARVADARTQLSSPLLQRADSDPDEAVGQASRVADTVASLQATAERYRRYQRVLHLPVSDFEELDTLAQEASLTTKLWSALRDWTRDEAAWREAPLVETDPDSLTKSVRAYQRVAQQCERGMEAGASHEAVALLRNRVHAFQAALPAVDALRCARLKDRHWEELHGLLGAEVRDDPAFTVEQLLEAGAASVAGDVARVAVEATQEGKLEDMLAQMERLWSGLELEVQPYRGRRSVFILGSTDEVEAALDDSAVTVNALLSSRYVRPLRERVEAWQHQLAVVRATLEEWRVCQKNWMRLENVFMGSQEMQRQLSRYYKLFSSIDESWKNIMRQADRAPDALEACARPGLRDTLRSHNDMLERIQRAVEEYLEVKRAGFPRFYFLSNDELLEILSHGADAQAVQSHLLKCFENVAQLEFAGGDGGGESVYDIVALVSMEGERISLSRSPPLRARGPIEEWLSALEKRMREAVRRAVRAGLAANASDPRHDWVQRHPAQVVSLVGQLDWCHRTEQALHEMADDSGALRAWHAENVSRLARLTALVRGSLTALQRLAIVALVTADVHARDIVAQLVDEGVESTASFSWQQQLRYYWADGPGECTANQASSRIDYGLEYEGCPTRLVITPLTDRCWLTITGALRLALGANPAGPAGTGKTESSKDLAKALGIFCVVFNCSEQVTFRVTGQLLRGLAASGSWACLDEFNLIDVEVLSVVAQQMLVLRRGMLEGAATVSLAGQTTPLQRHLVIVTMNPGYAGRTELPDNLQTFFRPVAMMVPDYALIAEIMLFAEGFDTAPVLSRKMVKLHKLCSEQLSQQQHYDYGLRALKSVLAIAGTLKRAEPDLDEDVVLIRAMRDSNLPKFLADDLPLFQGIVGDLFPGAEVPYSDQEALEGAVAEVTADAGLAHTDAFAAKVVQLFETASVRFGVALVGGAGSGKSTCRRTLADALTRMHAAGVTATDARPVHTTCLNPKAVALSELYGSVDELTQEWRPGLASGILRRDAAHTDEDYRWTVFDGPVDALWIENMNTVLDDNRMLCLANGERIKLRPQMRMLFEAEDLDQASPATVSRLGVVYVADSVLGWEPHVRCWAARHLQGAVPDEVTEHILGLFRSLLPPALRYLRASLHEAAATCDQNIVASLCTLFGALFPPAFPVAEARPTHTAAEDDEAEAEASEEEEGEKDEEEGATEAEALEEGKEDEKETAGSQPLRKALLDCGEGSAPRALAEWKELANQLFAFAFVWSVGGAVAASDRAKWSDYVIRLFEAQNLLVFDYATSRVGGSVYDAFFSVADGDFVRWEEIVPSFIPGDMADFHTLFVPTEESVRYEALAELLAGVHRPVYFTGVTGTGKSRMMAHMLQRLQAAPEAGGMSVEPHSFVFSACTDAAVTQGSLERKLERKRRGLLGAPAGKRAVVFIDDINMPAVQQYGAVPVHELLRQAVDLGGVYDRGDWSWTRIQDAMLVAAAAPAGGGRSPVSARLMRHFHTLCVPPAGEDALKHIFGSIATPFLAGFSPDVARATEAVVVASIELYQRAAESLLPTPAHFHYSFNLRDLGRVFQGLLAVLPSRCRSHEALTSLWTHECLRVFHDRLVSDGDRHWLLTVLHDLLERHFRVSDTFEERFEQKELPLWGDFLHGAGGGGDYMALPSSAKAGQAMAGALDEYNLTAEAPMDLVFFHDAVEHVCRIARVLRQPRGSALLVGVGGSGRQSLARIACFLEGVACFQPVLTRGYGGAEFREDVKKLCWRAGAEGASVCLLMTDSQIVEEAFLEVVNALLNSGEVPGLFAGEEQEQVVDAMRSVAADAGLAGTPEVCRRLFADRVHRRLHVALCMSPVGKTLRQRCSAFPSLVSCTTIDWFSLWPEEALRSVAQRRLGEVDFGGDDVRDALVDVCVSAQKRLEQEAARFLHELGRHVYATPKSFLDMIGLYTALLARKRGETDRDLERLTRSVACLDDTHSVVRRLEVELQVLKPELAKKSAETETLLRQVARERDAAGTVRERVAKDETEVAGQAQRASDLQAEAQADLDEAMPALEAAVKALDALDKNDITEMKSFTTPPRPVMRVMEAINILLGHKADWATAKTVLSDFRFLDNLKAYDKDNVADSALQRIQEYVTDPAFSAAAMAKVSKAATSLCMWVHAIDNYSRVNRVVAPKMEMVKQLNAALAEANTALAEKQEELRVVSERLASLEQQCEETQAEKERLAHEEQVTERRLANAARLTDLLATENVRWRERIEELRVVRRDLVGDAFLSAACVSYIGAFTGPFRDRLVAAWAEAVRAAGIPASSPFTLAAALTDSVRLREWRISGLPTDTTSGDSAIIAYNARRWPLMIDPQGQATAWVRRHESRRGVRTVKASSASLLREVTHCVREGLPVLVEGVDETLDPSLGPILRMNTYRQGGATFLRVGEEEVTVDDRFRLFLASQLPNPHFLPSVWISTTVINFTVTESGLEDQLLGDVVKSERPDVEKRRDNLVTSIATDRAQLFALEEEVLTELTSATGNVLDNEHVIAALVESKRMSAIVSERVQDAEATQVEIGRTREQFRPAAARGSLLFFVVADMGRVDPMYQFSLAYFKRLFAACLRDAPAPPALQQRLNELVRFQTRVIFENVCRGLFERHKLLFSFLICTNIMRAHGRIAPHEWTLLLRGPAPGVAGAEEELAGGSDTPRHAESTPRQRTKRAAIAAAAPKESERARRRRAVGDAGGPALCAEEAAALVTHGSALATDPAADGEPAVDAAVSERGWEMVYAIEDEVRALRGLSASLELRWSEWEAWVTSDSPHTAPLPSYWDGVVTPFQRLLLLRALRMDRLAFGVAQLVREQLGRSFVRFAPPSMEEVYESVDARTPCILVLSPGSDPTELLLRFAESRGHAASLHNVSLGQGQGPVAAALVERAASAGEWVLLQNCHLARSWMPELERIVAELAEGKAPGAGSDALHPEFRLFLTSHPVPYFPVHVLQNGAKITNEPPKGVRATLQRSVEMLARDGAVTSGADEENDGGASSAFRALFFGLSFFHAVVQERRQFGPPGWNIRYQFNDSDLETSTSVLRLLLNEAGPDGDVPWDALRFLTGHIHYGGRVTDDWDRRCLMTIFDKFIHPALLRGECSFTPSGAYTAPSDTSLQGMKERVAQFPASDPPEVFGMHPNADVGFQEQEAKSLLDHVLALQPRTAVSKEGQAPESVVYAWAGAMEEELPPLLSKGEADKLTFQTDAETGLMDSLATFLSQEIAKFNALLARVGDTLHELRRAIRGEVELSASLDAMFVAILNNQVPQLWSDVAYPSLKPLASWMEDLRQRVAFMRRWIHRGEPPLFHLPAFFFPQGFLTAALQRHARKFQIAINSLEFSYHVLESGEVEALHRADQILAAGEAGRSGQDAGGERGSLGGAGSFVSPASQLPESLRAAVPEDGVVVTGLHLECARWDDERRIMAEARPREMHSALPPVLFLPEVHHRTPRATYLCPVYKTITRAGALSTTGISTNFVVAVELPSAKHSRHWVLRGAALLLEVE